ncbi:MAG TPA: hypothetical protein VFN91_06330 [Myxococcaceae bacterium]|nr:hypothetical protein [Myxococcaceae bacterium]
MSVREARSSFVESCVLAKLLVPLLVLATACGDGGDGQGAGVTTGSDALHSSPTLTPQTSGTANRLDAVSVVNEHVVWASGRLGTVVRTIDGGKTWEVHVIPGAETLSFRDINAFSKDVAFVLSNTNPPNARIYKTEDGGQTWTLQFQSPINPSFYDCFAFFNEHAGIAVPDGENGHFDVIRMTDGHTWENIGDVFPPAQVGEGFFPASGTCITTHGGRRAWAVSGGAAHPRVIATADRGDTWQSYDIPIGGTASSGGLSIAFRDNHHGIIGGGEVAAPSVFQPNNFARSRDGGKTWELTTAAPLLGPIFGVAYAKHSGGGDDDGDGECHDVRVVATGPGGTAWSPDEGDSWQPLSGLTGLVSVGFANPHTGWLVGSAGRIVRIDF